MMIVLPDGSCAVGTPWEVQELLNLRNPVPYVYGTQTIPNPNPWGDWCQEHQCYRCRQSHTTCNVFTVATDGVLSYSTDNSG